MVDAHALPRLVDELAWTLRRAGFVIAPSQVIDLARVVEALGWQDRLALQEATAALVLRSPRERPRLDEAFASFFARPGPSRDLWARLGALGFTDGEVGSLRELLEGVAQREREGHEQVDRLVALLAGGTELDRLLCLAGVRLEIDRIRSPLQVGFFTQRASRTLGLAAARERLAGLRLQLREALGERGDALVDALEGALDRAADALRAQVQHALGSRAEDDRAEGAARRLEEASFASLTDTEREEVCRAVRAFVDRLRGAERVRTRHARRGRLDPGRTMRTLARTGGVPFRPARRRRRRDRPRIILLCDVSESVRAVSRFMLELVHAAHELFDRTRSFVFVSELSETTALFERGPAKAALAAIGGGEIVPLHANSNYGRVLRAFEARHLPAVDRRTTVVVLGDGRTNYHDASEQTLGRIRARARAVYWLCPEPRRDGSTGDSAMSRYEPHCTRVLEVTCAGELEAAARTLARSR
jgi:uncharacterized protein with von Willebrand factor type A (vWA) domain